MGGAGFDRQVFIKNKEPKQVRPSRPVLPGALILLLVAALGAFAAYRYMNAKGFSTPSSNNNLQLAEISKRMDVIEKRLDALEKKRRSVAAVERHVTSAEAAQPASPAEPARQVPAPVRHVAPAVGQQHPVKALQSTRPLVVGAAGGDAAVKGLRSDLSANHQEWQATVNRLGDVVGQLGTQQTAIKQNQNDVNELLQITRRTGVPFTLARRGKIERVGPISMALSDADVKDQRYSLRLIVDDKSVELRDRALNEVIQFFTTRSQYPLELVVSQIDRGKISGMLAVPNDVHRAQQNRGLSPR